MEEQKVLAYVQFQDVTPYYLDGLPKVNLHWRIYISPEENNCLFISPDNYWVVCGRTPEEAIKRFESFSVYEVVNWVVMS